MSTLLSKDELTAIFRQVHDEEPSRKREAYEKLVPHVIADLFGKYDSFLPVHQKPLVHIDCTKAFHDTVHPHGHDAIELPLLVAPEQLPHLHFDELQFLILRDTGDIVMRLTTVWWDGELKSKETIQRVELQNLPDSTFTNIYANILHNGDPSFQDFYRDLMRKNHPYKRPNEASRDIARARQAAVLAKIAANKRAAQPKRPVRQPPGSRKK